MSSDNSFSKFIEGTKQDIIDIIEDFKDAPKRIKHSFNDYYEDFKLHIIPQSETPISWKDIKLSIASWIHIPYFPSFHRPGWLLRYVVGPYNNEWQEMFIGDVWAGLTVGKIV